MDKEVIIKIIEAANQAPSGGNSQPWKFVVQNDTLQVIILPEKDHPVLNYKNRGTYVAFGALLENIKIASQSLGYEAVVNISFEPRISSLITFRSIAVNNNDGSLYTFISKRHSNRKSYKTTPISNEVKDYIFHDVNNYLPCRVALIEGESIRAVAESTGIDLYVFLQNKLLHKMLFDEMLWREADQHQHSGLYVKTMEAVPPKSFVLKMLSYWRVAEFFHKIKFSKKIYEGNVGTLASSGLYGAIIVPNTDDNFIHAGRLIENIWLRTAKEELSFQLVAGLTFLCQQMNFGEKKLFSQSEVHLISGACSQLRKAFDVKEEEIIVATFRVGEGLPPMAVSYKRPPEVDWI